MFTGIIESAGLVKKINLNQKNAEFLIESSVANDCAIGASIAHNGVCLTVETLPAPNRYTVTAIAETLSKTSLGDVKEGDAVNLEQSLRGDGRIDGHFVQGHVDTCGTIHSMEEVSGSHEIWIEFPAQEADLIVPRGSIAVDGISLTVAELDASRFKVAIIPHTMQHTNLKQRKAGDRVNLEFDILGKYIRRMVQHRHS